MKKYFLSFFYLAVGFDFTVTNIFACNSATSASSLRGIESMYVNVGDIDGRCQIGVKGPRINRRTA
jgi:hypothetical protein